MRKKDYNVIIVGLGMAAITAAERLTELGIQGVAMFGTASGASAHLSAFNLCTNTNKGGDTPIVFAEDVLRGGCRVQNPDFVYEMCARSQDCYELLLRWGADFAKNEDGTPKLRQTCGSSKPRTLHVTTPGMNVGKMMTSTMLPKLEEAGVSIFRGYTVVRLLVAEGRVVGVTTKDPEGKLEDVYAPVVMAAWGGVGRLMEGTFEGFGPGTGHPDLNGNALGMAYCSGAKVVDMEFLEYEPVCFLGKYKGAVATTQLAEGQPDHGIAIRNNKGERFLFNVRPEGEAGVPKAVLNREVIRQVMAGNGSPEGGCYFDFSACIREGCNDQFKRTFANLDAQGVDVKTTWIPFGPKPHSHSGGLVVDRHYATTLPGLYAAGEAIGGSQGADRAGGMGGGQAALTGLICGESIACLETFPDELPECTTEFHMDAETFAEYTTRARAIAHPAFPVARNEKDLAEAIAKLDEILAEDGLKKDDNARYAITAMRLMLNGALLRRESRGVHNRSDYPDENPEFAYGIIQ